MTSSTKETPRRIKSDALDAHRVKVAEVRQRLAKTFVGFAKLPYVKKCADKLEDGDSFTNGYVILATDGIVQSAMNENYGAFIIGNPDEHVLEAKDIIHHTRDLFAMRYSDADVHAVHPESVLANYAKALLEDKDEPRGLGVETMFVESSSAHLHWSSHDGSHGDESLTTRSRKVYICGCYDLKLRKQVERMLMEQLLRYEGEVNEKYLKQVARNIKRLTRLRHVRIVTMGSGAVSATV